MLDTNKGAYLDDDDDDDEEYKGIRDLEYLKGVLMKMMRIITNLKELGMLLRVIMGNIIIEYMKAEEANIMNH